MTECAKLEMLKAITGEQDENVLFAYLSLAGDKVCRKAYPFNTSVTEVPEQYGAVQVEIAAYMLNKRGAEGQTAHSENGISRTYENADVPLTLLRDITPCVAVIGGDTE